MEFENAIAEIDLVTGTSTVHSKPAEGTWTYVPRNSKMMVKVDASDGEAATTTLSFYDTWLATTVATVTANVNTSKLAVDVLDTWIADDGSIGAAVFAPTPSTPSESLEYVIVVFDKNVVRDIRRVKPKVDVDIYVRPHPDEGVLVYIRGNGISFPPSTEEVFTNASYIVYGPDGALKQLSLPERGPGSGKGRRIIWHSNKWDRLLFADEYASGGLLVKASNGIPVDTIDQSSLDPTKPLRFLTACGNNNDRWMVTHAKVGEKNALILWAMPETVETETLEFETSDPALKQMPLSQWSILIPFLSVSTSGNALYAWDPQDVVSVHEAPSTRAAVSPLPSSDRVRIALDGWNGSVQYAMVDAVGTEVERGFGIADFGSLDVHVSHLPSGVYLVTIQPVNESSLCRYATVVVRR